jgi:hypothetical protein
LFVSAYLTPYLKIAAANQKIDLNPFLLFHERNCLVYFIESTMATALDDDLQEQTQ